VVEAARLARVPTAAVLPRLRRCLEAVLRAKVTASEYISQHVESYHAIELLFHLALAGIAEEGHGAIVEFVLWSVEIAQ